MKARRPQSCHAAAPGAFALQTLWKNARNARVSNAASYQIRSKPDRTLGWQAYGIGLDTTQYVRFNCKIAVVPLVSLPTINCGLPFGDFAAGTKRTPSGPRSPILPIVTPSGSGPLAGLRLSSVRSIQVSHETFMVFMDHRDTASDQGTHAQ